MSVKFYICNHCKNIITKMNDSGVPVVCCGEKMTELIPGTSDGAHEKHVPAFEVNGNKVSVKVGSVEHPMMEICFLPLFRKRYQYNPAVLLASATLYISLLDQVIDRDRQSSHRHRYRTCHRGHILRFPDSDRFDHMHVVYGNILIF